MEDVTDPKFAGVPKGVFCIAEGSYSPIGLMEALCDKIDSMNTSIKERFPGQYDETPLTAQDVGFRMKIVPRVPRPDYMTVTVRVNPDYNPNDPDSPTHYIGGDDTTPIFLDCSKYQNGTFINADKIDTSFKILMSIFRERITQWNRHRNPTLPKAAGFDVYTKYIGSIALDGKRKVVVNRSTASGVMISRPYTPQEAPSLYPESN